MLADSAVKSGTGICSGTCICRAPQDLTWTPPLGSSSGSRAHKLGDLQHCWDAPEALKDSQGRWLRKASFSTVWLPWSQESKLILKTLNRFPVMDSCASENLLLVPQNIVFQIRGDSEKLCLCLCVCVFWFWVWGDWTERNWSEF